MKNKEKIILEIFELVNTLTEEKNYIEILKGYCENNLDKSDDYNKIYPLIEKIYSLHLACCARTDKSFG